MISQAVFNFKYERTDKQLTANAGLAFFGRYIYGLGILQLANRFLKRPGSNRGYLPSDYVSLFNMLLNAGGRSLEDTRVLNNDHALHKLLGTRELPSPDAAGDWLRRTGETGLPGLGLLRDTINARLMKQSDTTVYTLDVDATEILAAKQTAEVTYKGNKGYMPMLGFLAENQLCIADEFRTGNESPNSNQVQFYETCVRNMPHGKRIGYYRSDSAGYQAKLFNILERDNVRFAIAVPLDPAVCQAIARGK